MGKARNKRKQKKTTRDPKGELEAILILLKMSREVGLYHIETHPDGLRLNVNRGDLFAGDDLAAYITDLSKDAITADRITVRQ